MRADMTVADDRHAAANAVGVGVRRSTLDVLVNNAGGNIRKKALDYSPEEVEGLLTRNFTSAFELSRLMHPLLKRAAANREGGSAVVNIGSVAGLTAIRTGVPYGASKAAISAR